MSAQRPGRRFPRAWPVINVIRSQYPEAPASVVAWAIAHGANYRSAGAEHARLGVDEIRARIPLDALLARAGLA